MKILVLIAFFLFTNKALSQTAFFDAQYIAKLSKDQLQNILYASNDLSAKDSEQSKDTKQPKPNKPYIYLSENEVLTVNDYIRFIQNPVDPTIKYLDLNLLKSAIDKYNIYVTNELRDLRLGPGRTMGFAPFGLTSALSLIPSVLDGAFSLSSEQQTKIIDGLTKYYAEEFRKAQLLSYMQNFKKIARKTGELRVFFPKTFLKLENADPSKFPGLGDEYKSIFNDDLKNMPKYIIDHVDRYGDTGAILPFESSYSILNTTNSKMIKSNGMYAYFKLTADIGSKLINNFHPAELLTYLDNQYFRKSMIPAPNNIERLYVAIHGLNLIQQNLLDTTKSRTNQSINIWLNINDLKQLDSEVKWKYFVALIYQQDKDFFNKFIWDTTGKDFSKISSDDLENVKQLTKSILQALTEIKNFKVNIDNESLRENYLDYMQLLVKCINTSYFFKDANNQASVDAFTKISSLTMNIYDNARKKDYNNTIFYGLTILKEFIPINDTLKTLEQIEKYGNFMVDVVNATNSDEIKEVIKQNVAPPASFIQKREFKFTLSFTGQPGYFIGVEKLKEKNKKYAFVSGITLPIGLDASFKIKHGKENNGSINLFAQLIDLGAVLNFRLADSTSTLPDKFEFKQFFSPGGSISYGFPNSPITLGLGYQYTPELRKINDNGNQSYPNENRFFFRLAWDIPLINIIRSKSK